MYNFYHIRFIGLSSVQFFYLITILVIMTRFFIIQTVVIPDNTVYQSDIVSYISTFY